MALLTENEIAERLRRVPGWQQRGHQDLPHLAFADFKAAMAFVNRRGGARRRGDHHPTSTFATRG